MRRILSIAKRLLLLCFETIKILLNINKRKIFVFGSPYHSNLGDQAQTYCTKVWISKKYPDYKVYIYDTSLLSWRKYIYLKVIKLFSSSKKDIIFLHSGYHTTDLYMLEENMQRKVIKLFPDHKIVVLPQTINYIDPNEEKISRKIYNSHKKMLLMCRDYVSYKKAQSIFPKVKLLLFPDIVTTMIGTREYHNERSGVLLCLRNDKEGIYTTDRIESLKRELSKFGRVDITDTTVSTPAKKIIADRIGYLEKTWDMFSRYKMVITDRYHGTIFSMIAATPVIVISSSDHKLSSGVKWFPDSFSDYIYYEQNIDNVINIADKIYNTKYDYKLPQYFNTEYYDKLKGKITEMLK